MPTLSLEINNQFNALARPEAAARALFEALQASGAFPITEGELSIAFVSDAEIAQVHADFMDDPTPTDVITFPADEAMDSAGEIIVSVDHARTRAAELGEPFSRELSLYLVHGWLHLAGYDDRNESDRAAMRSAEQKALSILDSAEHKIEFQLKA
ncbi:rRNA maturation RNase YbeY [Coraliomargarita sp. SDUM461004]|uniref:Endoribonuclease YbeY n=1 Tax=Thalassobacterium sedimentorum TaxID=3041258 RepID=A0ABU1AN52_9BACT|nr:rRNA maturation RNase YbeY [Coraliomargarita sp. SDUM461004]MDQ8196227.1 rRNA maturation RNase YbeY [Coraliomargarita sp. SDUM461004]